MQMMWEGEERTSSESLMHLGFYFPPHGISAYLSEYLSSGEMIRLQRSLKWSSLAYANIEDVRRAQADTSHTMDCHGFEQIPQGFQTIFVESERRLKLVVYNNMFSAEQSLYLLVLHALKFLLGHDTERRL